MSAPELVAGSVVAGKYTIRSPLLHGGAMATYRAVAAKNREVALKIYDPAILAFPDVLKTLAQHQSLSAKLASQQVVPIAESGTDSNWGAPFTVTDFESGPSLAKLIDRGPLSASAMVALVRNLARATDLLHSSGITSLSLHPTNVFVPPGPQYEVRVADCGASMVRRALPVPEKAGRWMPWLAPEQIKGAVPPAQAADIFALALIAFFAVTGKPYWRSSQLKVPDTAALRREILGERMPASVRAGEFSITLNPSVDAVFARALAFRPADRYATAREFAAGLDAAISGRSLAEVDADRRPTANAASATVKTDEAESVANRAASPGDVAGAQRMAAPPPRKMAQRATMLGMGNPAFLGAKDPSAPRPPLATMVGIGEPVAEAKTAAPAKPASPALAPAPAKPAPPMFPTAPAKPTAPAFAPAPAKPAPPAFAPAPAKAAPTMMSAQRGTPPPLPMVPPPAQMEEVLAKFEAGPPAPLPVAVSPAPSREIADVVQASPAWPTAAHGDSGAEREETGVAVVGASFADTLKSKKLRWVASIGGLLVLTGGAAWALSATSTPGSRGRAASGAKVIATAPTAGAEAAPISAEPPSAAAEPPAANPEPQRAEETPPAAPLEPAAPEPPPPAAQEPQAGEPAAPAAPRPQSSKKPCGKFLKRCK